MRTTTVVGLTGQTGAGKTTVCSILKGRDVAIIDADQVARDVVDEKKQCLADLALEFSISILNVDGTLNRERLASIVFGDKTKLKKLNSIIFPYILAQIREKIDACKKAGDQLVVLDAPTLFESGADSFCDVVLSVVAPETQRLNRIVIRDRLGDAQARARMGAQHPDEFYTKRSKYVIVNDGDLEELRLKTLQVIDQILADAQEAQ